MNCKYCGCEMEYMGVDDNGESLGELWNCPNCDWIEFVEVYNLSEDEVNTFDEQSSVGSGDIDESGLEDIPF